MPVLFLFAVFGLVSGTGCPKTADRKPLVDSSHVFPAECTAGELRCVVNMLEECELGRFRTSQVCAGACLASTGCQPLPENVTSYIWIANTGEGTLSKVNTQTVMEEARYNTCADESRCCDPSRTSVSLHGDAVVTNRASDYFAGCSPPASSVVMFAASRGDCVDRNGNGVIDTSTGPTDVRPFGEDECMVWSTDLPYLADFGDDSHGARATAWDGSEDEETGLGGRVWIGTCNSYRTPSVHIFRLDGDCGTVLDEVQIPDVYCAYGGAVDATGSLWFLDNYAMKLVKVDSETLAWESRPTSCAYGITLDSLGRVWTGGWSSPEEKGACTARYDPSTGEEHIVEIPRASPAEPEPFLRGIAAGVGLSAGYIWAAETDGVLYQVDKESLEIIGSLRLGPSRLEMIGVAVDHIGYVWTVSFLFGMAFKVDPFTFEHLSLAIGKQPYTYSDMTGTQLRAVVVVR
ncbi:MAG: hypothetical protein RBU30_23080 [Polyangia bacterium]|jgi:streptogramin lyase|nr:hypothetical protein [Polyangia bacterium]